MRNRWFHIPLLHTPALQIHKKVSWLELFYDLIFVAAFIQLGEGLSHHVSLEGFLGFSAIFVPLWVVWTGFTFYSNRFAVDDFVHRILVLAKMMAVGAMAVTAPEVLNGQPIRFALAYALAQFLIAVLYLRSYRHQPQGREYSRYWGTVFALGAGLWFFSIFLTPSWAYVAWAIGLGAILASPFNRHSRALREEFPIDQDHLSERYGLLTIIVLGESFVEIISGLSGQAASMNALSQASLTLLITCCLWWIYFDDVAGSKLKNQKLAPMIWLYGHLPLQLAMTAVGVAVKKAVFFDLGLVAEAKYRWLLCGALGLTIMSVGIIDYVTERRQAQLSDRNRVVLRFMSGLLILLLAPAGQTMTAGWFLFWVMLMCVAQVVFDMMMAPLEADSTIEDSEAIDSTEIAKLRGEKSSKLKNIKRIKIGQSIRKGTPNELRSDIYYFLMEGSWTKLFVSILFLYITLNLFFGCLYLLDPGSIANAAPKSFADAFFFSVQTMSTIGYGVLAPQTAYGNVIVTIEAAVGLIGVALITGLMFAKASRPRSSIIFSDKMVLTTMHGQKMLMFRVGNARGNDIIDAHIHLSALMEDTSSEGHHIRRIRDLKLVRSHSPFFTLSWMVMHPLDEKSPLYGLDLDDPHSDLLAINATMTGHDGTYGQTIYSRHTYFADQVYPDAMFVDVVSQLPDGRLMVDYGLFHELQSS